MAEAITIPSPSVFLRASPPPPSPPPREAAQHVRRQISEAKKKAARKSSAAGSGPGDGCADKPKQSKSRNGRYRFRCSHGQQPRV